MEHLIHIWDTIVKSNTFNFIVMLLLLGWIVKKFDLKASLDNLKANVKKSIDTSVEEKEKGIITLKNAEKSVENLETEIKENLVRAEKQASDITNEIMAATENKVKDIEANIQKAIKNEEKQISAKLMSNTAKNSSELAKQKIEKLLEEHPELHEKFITESLEELDRIEL